jgi:hypothetical protein
MQAEPVLRTGQADAVALGRGLLRIPIGRAMWRPHAISWPLQYPRARP